MVSILLPIPHYIVPFITFLRYFSKYNLSKKLDKDHDLFSERELFPSNFFEHISPEAILEKVTVMSFEDFERKVNAPDPKVYFSR